MAKGARLSSDFERILRKHCACAVLSNAVERFGFFAASTGATNLIFNLNHIKALFNKLTRPEKCQSLPSRPSHFTKPSMGDLNSQVEPWGVHRERELALGTYSPQRRDSNPKGRDPPAFLRTVGPPLGLEGGTGAKGAPWEPQGAQGGPRGPGPHLLEPGLLKN